MGKTCFVIAPIGQVDSPDRQRLQRVVQEVITPPLRLCGYDPPIRPDEIDRPGLITRQVIENITQDALIIADLTGHNPNVFYELALCHVMRRPVIQLIRRGDPIPFDVQPTRTIEIDLSTGDAIREAQIRIAEQIRAIEAHPESRTEIADLLGLPAIHDERFSGQERELLGRFARCGLRNAFRIPPDDHAREDRVRELVSDERKRAGRREFRLLASSGFSYLAPMGKVWRAGLGEAISEGVHLSVVLESPFSEFAFTRALASKVHHHHWEEKVNITQLRDIEARWAVEIRVTEHPVNGSLFFTSKAVFYDPYLWSKPRTHEPVENHFWVFEFGKTDEPDYDCYDLLGLHFEFLHRESLPLREFLGAGNENYREGTEQFHKRIRGGERKEER